MCLHLSKHVSWRHGGSKLLSCHFCLKLLPHAIGRSVTDLLSDRTELICYFCTQTFFYFFKGILDKPRKSCFLSNLKLQLVLCKAITYPGMGPSVLELLILLEKSVQSIFNELTLQIKSFLFELLHYTNTSDLTHYTIREASTQIGCALSRLLLK